MSLDEMIAVLQAAKEGKTIQFYRGADIDTWVDCIDHRFNFYHYIYRIKPAEKKLVPHWPALVYDGARYRVTDTLYSKASPPARSTFFRLATELPPIMLEVEE